MFDKVMRQLLLIGAIMALIIVGYSAFLFYGALRADRIQDTQTGILLKSKVVDHDERIAAALERRAVSNELFDVLEKGDQARLEGMCGGQDIIGQFSTFGLLGADGVPLLLCEDGRAKPTREQTYVFAYPRAAVETAYELQLALRRSKGIALPEFTYTQSFTEVAGRPYTMLTALVAPERTRPVSPSHRPVIAFVLSNLRVAVQRLQDQLNIQELEYQISPADMMNATQSLADKQGALALTLHWTQSHSFRDQLMSAMPLIIAMALALFKLVVILLRRIGLLQQAIVEREAEMRHIALHDGLTGLPNRNNFMYQAQRALASSRLSRPVFIGIFDLDRFKSVNDTYGHDVGDRLIVEAARRASKSVAETDVVARLGGDEFALMLRSAKTDQDAMELMERLQQEIRQEFDCGTAIIRPSASIGLASAPRDGELLEQILKAADIALYEVKSEGRGFGRIYAAKPRRVPVPA